MNRYSERARIAFHFALTEADNLGAVVNVEHLLLGLLQQQTAASAALNGAGVTLTGTRKKVQQKLAARDGGALKRLENEMTPELEAVTRLTDETQNSPVEPEHLLAMLEHGSENLQDLVGDTDRLRRQLNRDSVSG